MIARGQIAAPAAWITIPSPLLGVSDAEWTAFVQAMRTRGPRDVSQSGAVGAWEMRSRRVEELGFSVGALLASEILQCRAFGVSTAEYDVRVLGGAAPAVMTRAEALCFLHRTAPKTGDVVSWSRKMTASTRVLCEKVRGCF